MACGLLRQLFGRACSLLRLQPRLIKKLDKGEGQENEEENHPGQENNQGEKQPEIRLKGDIAEPEGGHDGQRPVEAGYPAVFPALVQHQEMKKQAVERNKDNEKADKLGQNKEVSFGRSVVEKVDENRQGFHGVYFMLSRRQRKVSIAQFACIISPNPGKRQVLLSCFFFVISGVSAFGVRCRERGWSVLRSRAALLEAG